MDSARQFEAIVSQHYASLFKFAMSLTHVESDAQDLTQQTFYIWATKGHQLRDISKVKTWLFTTLHRAFLEFRRRGSRFEHHPLEEVSDQLPMLEPGLSEQLDSTQALAALAQLDPVYRAAIALFYLEDCSYKEIAEILGTPIGTVKSRIARGILKLRDLLDRARPDPESAASHRDEPAKGVAETSWASASCWPVPDSSAGHQRKPGLKSHPASGNCCVFGHS